MCRAWLHAPLGLHVMAFPTEFKCPVLQFPSCYIGIRKGLRSSISPSCTVLDVSRGEAENDGVIKNLRHLRKPCECAAETA